MVCSRLDWFNHRAADLCRFLVAREYKKAFVLKQIRRARLKSREETLAPRPRNATNRVPVVVTYHPSLPNIGSQVRFSDKLFLRRVLCSNLKEHVV